MKVLRSSAHYLAGRNTGRCAHAPHEHGFRARANVAFIGLPPIASVFQCLRALAAKLKKCFMTEGNMHLKCSHSRRDSQPTPCVLTPPPRAHARCSLHVAHTRAYRLLARAFARSRKGFSFRIVLPADGPDDACLAVSFGALARHVVHQRFVCMSYQPYYQLSQTWWPS